MYENTLFQKITSLQFFNYLKHSLPQFFCRDILRVLDGKDWLYIDEKVPISSKMHDHL